MKDDDINLIDFIHAIRAEWRLVAVVTGIAAVVSIVVSLALTEVFRAEAGIVKSGASGGGSTGSSAMLRQFGGIAGLAGIDLSALAGDKTDNSGAILRSRSLVETFIARNDLLPVLFPDADEDEPPTLWLGVREFTENILTIRDDVTTGVTYVTVDWTDPTVAAAWANGLVALTNEIVRERDRIRAERNIEFLNQEIERTSVVELQRVLYGLIETEMQTLMLANANPEYAFTVIDPAVAPEKRVFPQRAMLVIIGTFFGGFIALLIVLIRILLRHE